LTCALLLAATAAAQSPPFSITWQESALSVTAEKVDIVTLLEAVRAKTGLDIQGIERLNALPAEKRIVSVAFENLLLPDAVHELLSGFSYGLVGFFVQKPGTPDIMVFISSAPSAPAQRPDETRSTGERAPGPSVTVRTEDGSGTPLDPETPGDGTTPTPSPPLQRAEERAESGSTGAQGANSSPQPSVTVRVGNDSGQPIASVPTQSSTASSAHIRPEEMAQKEAIEKQRSGSQGPDEGRKTPPR
jgi:hypothetical protein